MKVKTRLRQAAFKRHLWIDRLAARPELDLFLSRFRKHYVSCDLMRIGGDGDGGYLLPNILDDISYCFSPGVDYVANFEKELSERFDIKSFMADASVQKPPLADKNFEFTPKFLGSSTHDEFITLSDWMNQSDIRNDENKILQMDIEGGEYDVLTYEDSATLASFSAMVIEFHDLEKLFERNFLAVASAIFEKIYRNFSICHVHPNNCCELASLDGVDVPPVIEVTFIRNDLVETLSNNNQITLPHHLDSKNCPQFGDYGMPEVWWKG